jgi:HPt (histidine-containing phosphotransfer) domain-containing protein
VAAEGNVDQFRDGFREEARELLVELESVLLELNEQRQDAEMVGRVFRALHTIKGSGAMFGFDALAAFAHRLENAFDEVRKGRLAVTPELVDLTLAALDQIRAMVEEGVGETAVDPAACAEILAKQPRHLNIGQHPQHLGFLHDALLPSCQVRQLLQQPRFRLHRVQNPLRRLETLPDKIRCRRSQLLYLRQHRRHAFPLGAADNLSRGVEHPARLASQAFEVVAQQLHLPLRVHQHFLQCVLERPQNARRRRFCRGHRTFSRSQPTIPNMQCTSSRCRRRLSRPQSPLRMSPSSAEIRRR